MAFADQNGKITIDEVAASVDIKNLEQSKALLEQALQMIVQTEIGAAEFEGDTSLRIVSYSQELQTDLKKQLDNLQTTIDAIKRTVARYQQIDQDLKKHINNTL